MVGEKKKIHYSKTRYSFDDFLKGFNSEKFRKFYGFGSVAHLKDFSSIVELVKEEFVQKIQKLKLI